MIKINRKGMEQAISVFVVLFVILAVAMVVLRIVGDNFEEQSENLQVIADEQALERAQSMIDSRCRTLCREAGTPVGNARYCEERLRPIDLNNNRRTDGYSASLSILGVCEDAIYCHVVYDCPRVTTADCVKHMCDYFTDSLGLTPTDAHARVNSRLDPGSCYEELSGDELRDHWWTVLDSNSNTNSSAWCD